LHIHWLSPVWGIALFYGLYISFRHCSIVVAGSYKKGA
jgi:hypothetical protein